jgi:hypothetical protein
MNKRFVSILAIVAVVLGIANSLTLIRQSVGAAPLSAPDVPQLISYQGRLTDVASNPLTGDYDMRFCLYAEPTGGTALWCETRAAVNDTAISVNYGVFDVLLGSVTSIPDSVFDETELYLGVKVEGDAEMTPRRRVVSVGYAYRAEEASTANYASSAGNADYATSAGNADTSDYATSAGSANTADYASSAGNADTVDYMHASDFASASHSHDGSEITSGTIAPERILGTGIAMMKTGTYTGNGQATQSITGVGFQPKVVIINMGPSTASGWYQKTDQDSGYYAAYHDGNVDVYQNDLVQLDADGFTVGDGTCGSGENPNTNGWNYVYIAYTW